MHAACKRSRALRRSWRHARLRCRAAVAVGGTRRLTPAAAAAVS